MGVLRLLGRVCAWAFLAAVGVWAAVRSPQPVVSVFTWVLCGYLVYAAASTVRRHVAFVVGHLPGMGRLGRFGRRLVPLGRHGGASFRRGGDL